VDTISTIDEVTAFGDTDTEASHVEIACCVEIGHDRGFAAEQSCPCLLAAVADAGDELFEEQGVIFSERDVVEEEERFGAEAETVVDAHRDEINADGVKDTGMNCDFDFRSDSIGTGDEYGILPLSQGVESEESGKPTWEVHDPGGERTFHERRQFLHCLFVEFEVNAGRAIGQI